MFNVSILSEKQKGIVLPLRGTFILLVILVVYLKQELMRFKLANMIRFHAVLLKFKKHMRIDFYENFRKLE